MWQGVTGQDFFGWGVGRGVCTELARAMQPNGTPGQLVVYGLLDLRMASSTRQGSYFVPFCCGWPMQNRWVLPRMYSR